MRNRPDDILAMILVWPSAEYLPGYMDALERGWSPNTIRSEAGREELERIAAGADQFLAEQVDHEAKGPPVKLPDGSTAARIPGYRRWLWDGEFCGIINLRWQPGTAELPPHCLGHIGYSIVPWKRNRGYATQALELLLPEVRDLGLPYVELTTDPDNVASRRVIEANGGVLFETFTKLAAYGGTSGLRYRIHLLPAPTADPSTGE